MKSKIRKTSRNKINLLLGPSGRFCDKKLSQTDNQKLPITNCQLPIANWNTLAIGKIRLNPFQNWHLAIGNWQLAIFHLPRKGPLLPGHVSEEA